jgi:hypothetical protein
VTADRERFGGVCRIPRRTCHLMEEKPMSHTIRGRVLPVVAGAAVLAGVANVTAYAANGHAFLLGRANTESSATTLSTSGHGPALSLRTARTSPPFAVNSGQVVKHLNADTVDGLHASKISHAFHYVLPKHRLLGISFRMVDLPKGTYLASYQVVTVNDDPDNSPTFCNLVDDKSPFALLSYGVPGPAPTDPGEDQIEISTATGLAVVKHQGHAILDCSDGDRLFSAEGSQNTVTFTRVAGTTQGKLKDVASRSSERRAHAFER